MNIKALLTPKSMTPFTLLAIMAATMWFVFGGWHVMAKNFAVEELAFTGREAGIQEAVREIPGFLSFLVVFVIIFIREQRLALTALILLCVGTAVTGYFATFYGFLLTTIIMSVGFHYYEAVYQSLSLQWLEKDKAPELMGKLISVGAFAQLASFATVLGLGWAFGLSYKTLFAIIGGAGLVVVLWCIWRVPMFAQPVTQHKKIILRKRYWLYYVLVFLSGTRRQIFVVFAAFLMIEQYGFSVEKMAVLFIINGVMSMYVAPKFGRLIQAIGERNTLIIEYVGLIFVFSLYAVVASPEKFGAAPALGTWSWWAIGGAALYIIDHAFFAMAIALKTYFQKIADPADLAPTAAVAFTINHIGAVTTPVLFGLLWLYSPAAVFICGAGIAVLSLSASILIPRAPKQGRETLLARSIK